MSCAMDYSTLSTFLASQHCLLPDFPHNFRSFLDSSWILIAAAGPVPSVTLAAFPTSQHELVDYVIAKLLKERRSNVLANGYAAAKGTNVQGFQHMEYLVMRQVNSVINIVKGPLFRALLNITGDALMMHLLMDCCIFILVDGPTLPSSILPQRDMAGAFIQVCGPPVSHLWRSTGQTSTGTRSGGDWSSSALPAHPGPVLSAPVSVVPAGPTPTSTPQEVTADSGPPTNAAQPPESRAAPSDRPPVAPLPAGKRRFFCEDAPKKRRCLRAINAPSAPPPLPAPPQTVHHMAGDKAAGKADRMPVGPSPRWLYYACGATHSALRWRGVLPNQFPAAVFGKELDHLSALPNWLPELHATLRCLSLRRFVRIVSSRRECASRADGGVGSRRRGATEDRCRRLMGLHWPHALVFRAVDWVLAQLPSAMWEAEANEARLRAVARRFITMGRFDVLPPSQWHCGFKTRPCAWLRVRAPAGPRHLDLQRRVLTQVVQFVCGDVLVPLLRDEFYVTERDSHPHAAVYYPQAVWRRLQRLVGRRMVAGRRRRGARPGGAEGEPGGLLSDSTSTSTTAVPALQPISAEDLMARWVKDEDVINPLAVSTAAVLCAALPALTPATPAAPPPASPAIPMDSEPVSGASRAGSGRKVQIWDLQPYNSVRMLPKVSSVRLISRLHRGLPYRKFLRDMRRVKRGPGCAKDTPAAKQMKMPSLAQTSAEGQAGEPTELSWRSTNDVLGDLYLVLQTEARQSSYGRSPTAVSSHNALYPALLRFVRAWKQQSPRPPIYFASVDVTGAFDTIPHRKLLEVVEPLLQAETYMKATYAVCDGHSGRYRRAQAILPRDHFGDFEAVLRSQEARLLGPRRAFTVFIDLAEHRALPRPTLLALLRRHVTRNAVLLGTELCWQSCGIPQGSRLSTLLCCLLYHHFEERCLWPALDCVPQPGPAAAPGGAPGDSQLHEGDGELHITIATGSQAASDCGSETSSMDLFPERSSNGGSEGDAMDLLLSVQSSFETTQRTEPLFPETPAGTSTQGGSQAGLKTNGSPAPPLLLLRWVDDFLCLGLDPRRVAAFAAVMGAGAPEYGIRINPQKTQTNLPPSTEAASAGPAGESVVRWCGLLLDVATGEVRADYGRDAGMHVQDLMAFRFTSITSCILRLKTWIMVRLALPLVCGTLNSPKTSLANVYTAATSLAKRFHCGLVHLEVEVRPTVVKHVLTLADCVTDLIAYRRRQLAQHGSFCHLPPSVVRWACLVAFAAVWRRRRRFYRPALPVLEAVVDASRRGLTHDQHRLCETLRREDPLPDIHF